MKKLLLLFGGLVLSMNTFSQGYTVNYESPTSVVNAIFYAAKTGEFEVLGTLCDPVGKGDGDVKNLCKLGYGLNEVQKKELAEQGKTEEEMKEEVKKVFGNGEIIGSTRFETNEYGNFAGVDFYFYPDGLEKRKETMNLIQRGNNWYLSSF
tara:strand:+ start:171 stop:623 length:453 start_codon:yes stop_codon:yes gene_type:complete